MDYEEIIELLQSGEAGQAELSRLAQPRRKRAVYLDESAKELINFDGEIASKSQSAAGLPSIEPEQFADPFYIRARQKQVEVVILQLGGREPEESDGRDIADRLVKEVSRYVASEQQLWPLLEDGTQDDRPGLSGLTKRSLKRNDEILELTSHAAEALIAGQDVAPSYQKNVLGLFDEEREDVDRIVKPLLEKAEVKYLRYRTQALYPSDNLDVYVTDNSTGDLRGSNLRLTEE